MYVGVDAGYLFEVSKYNGILPALYSFDRLTQATDEWQSINNAKRQKLFAFPMIAPNRTSFERAIAAHQFKISVWYRDEICLRRSSRGRAARSWRDNSINACTYLA
jgi:hypothetical protein